MTFDNLSSVPLYLRSSELYKTLKCNEAVEPNDFILIPDKYCKLDDTVNCQDDLMDLCHAVRYWGVPEIPYSLMGAAFGTLDIDWKTATDEFGEELAYLKEIAP